MEVCRPLAKMFCAAVLLAWAGSQSALASDALPASAAVLPVTNGLVRWWPDLFDAREEISGQEGLVMGVLPADGGAAEGLEFGQHTGWVQLQPALTNRTFTLAFWMRWRSTPWVDEPALLSQEGADNEWILRRDRNDVALYHFEIRRQGQSLGQASFKVPGDGWHHVGVACQEDGFVTVWVDGQRVFAQHVAPVGEESCRWLTAGNMVKGDRQWDGGVRDLCAFHRALTDAEVGQLHAAGLPRRPVRGSAARTVATAQDELTAWRTKVVLRPAPEMLHRRYTTEEGLPANIVQAVLQARDDHLWIGTEGGLARFDGRSFRTFTTENTPPLKAIGQDVLSLAEEADGTIWAGIYGGLLRIRPAGVGAATGENTPAPHRASRPVAPDRLLPTTGPPAAPQLRRSHAGGLEFTAFTHGLPERFIVQAEPAGDGSLWVAGFRLEPPRGLCRLRRFHPDTGISSAEVIVPGQLRRLLPATHGVWLATEQPELLLFWDGRSPALAVIAKASASPPTLRVSHAASVPAETQVRGWRGTSESGALWATIELGRAGPAVGWHWTTANSLPEAGWFRAKSATQAWLGCKSGLARLRGQDLEILETPDAPAFTTIACLATDRAGGVWFGTPQDGLHVVQERLVRVFTTRDGLGMNEIRSVCVQRDGTVVAAGDGPLSFGRDGQWTRTAEPFYLLSMVADPRGHLWAGLRHAGKLAVLRVAETGPPEFLLPAVEWSFPNALHLSSNGTLWVACGRGLTWIKTEALSEGTGALEEARRRGAFGRLSVGRELPAGQPLGLVEDRDGSIWAGTIGKGLIHVVPDGTPAPATARQVEVFTQRDGLPDNFCLPAHLDDSGALWVLTGSGLARRRAGRFQAIQAADGLPADLFGGLVEDDLGHFWLSGRRGIHRLDRRELEALLDGRIGRVRSLTLGVRDGLLTPECSSGQYPGIAKSADGRMWVATRHGLAVFDPRRVARDTQPLPAIIESLVVNREELTDWESRLQAERSDQPGETGPPRPLTLRLPAGSGRRLEFHYAAVSLTAADRLRFRHRLDGYDRDWSPETDLRLAFFTNLRPGDYRFRVKAANSHGVWNEQETTLAFTIAPYLWERRGFWVAVALGTGLIAAVLHRHRLGVLRRLEELKRRAELAAERERIAADMHDDLGSALTHITITGELAKTQVTDPAHTRRALERMTHAAREVAANVSELVWATDPRHDSIEELVVHLREQAALQLDAAGLRAQLDFPERAPAGRVSATLRRNLPLVVKEAIHNIVKHAGATEVQMRLTVEDRGLKLLIADNGQGFEPAAAGAHGHGLRNMRRRVEEVGGVFHLRSAAGQGTTVLFELPLAGGPPPSVVREVNEPGL